MNFLRDILAEDNGSPSTTRLVTLLAGLFILTPWAYVSCVKLELQPLTWEQVSMVLGCLGFKVMQKSKEQAGPALSPLPPAFTSSEIAALNKIPVPPVTSLLLLGLPLALGLTGCASAPAPHGIPNLAAVAPGIWRGGQPSAEGWQWLAAQGVTLDIKLNTGSGDAGACSNGLAVLALPITTADQIIGAPAARVRCAVLAIQPGTFIHCTHGQDRTGLVVACWRVKQPGWTQSAARAEMRALGYHPLLRGLDWVWETWPEPRD